MNGMPEEVDKKFTLRLVSHSGDVEIRSSMGRLVSLVKAMSSESLTLRYAYVMLDALNKEFRD